MVSAAPPLWLGGTAGVRTTDGTFATLTTTSRYGGTDHLGHGGDHAARTERSAAVSLKSI